MNVGVLPEKYRGVFGEDSRSSNKRDLPNPSLALEKFAITRDTWSILPTKGIIVGAMVARAQDRVDGDAHRRHE